MNESKMQLSFRPSHTLLDQRAKIKNQNHPVKWNISGSVSFWVLRCRKGYQLQMQLDEADTAPYPGYSTKQRWKRSCGWKHFLFHAVIETVFSAITFLITWSDCRSCTASFALYPSVIAADIMDGADMDCSPGTVCHNHENKLPVTLSLFFALFSWTGCLYLLYNYGPGGLR